MTNTNEPGLSPVEKRRAEIEALRKQLADEIASNDRAVQSTQEDAELAQLAAEEERLRVELRYQERVRAARAGQSVPTPAIQNEVVTPPAAPSAPAEATTPSNEAPAEADAKGKGK